VSLDNVAFTPINGTFFLQMYLDGNGNALVLGADEVELTAGPAYLQTTSTPTVFGAYGLSTMGFLTDQNGTPWSAAGPVTINSGSYTGFTDYSYGFLTGATLGTTVATQSLSGTTNSSSGVISLTGLNAVSFTGANSFVSYPVDGNRVVSISIDSGLLSLGTLESVKP
jgi:hypothetical protein